MYKAYLNVFCSERCKPEDPLGKPKHSAQDVFTDGRDHSRKERKETLLYMYQGNLCKKIKNTNVTTGKSN